MAGKEVIAKSIKLHSERLEQLKDFRVSRVLGFFSAKGLLVGVDENLREAMGSVKVPVKDVFWVAKHVEPRVLEVFPAALLRFPSSFLKKEDMPQEFLSIVNAIGRGEEVEGEYLGIELSKMKYWACHPLPDKRTKPVNEKKRTCSFRLQPKVIDMLEKLSRREETTSTQMIENLVLEAYSAQRMKTDNH